MNSRERFLAALSNRQPDRVPAAPDISNMVPCRRTGKPFWDIYLHGDPPLWRAHLDACRYYGFDAWFYRGHLDLEIDHTNEITHKIVDTTDERIVRETTIKNRLGTLTTETILFIADSPWLVTKPIKNPVTDIPVYIESMGQITGYSTRSIEEMREEINGQYAIGFGGLRYPGFQYWINLFDGGLEQILDVYAERPDLLETLRVAEHDKNLQMTDYYLENDPDYLFMGASGTLTLGSPDLFRAYGLATLTEITKRAAARGVPTLLHSCGRARELVRMCADETELSCINPLELPPMGDCELADVKSAHGSRMAFMGNLHTTDVMLMGSKQEVIEASKRAIEDAGENGGFILSTGDQCGRDTPDANLFAVTEAAEQYGYY